MRWSIKPKRRFRDVAEELSSGLADGSLQLVDLREALEEHGWKLERQHGHCHVFSKAGAAPILVTISGPEATEQSAREMKEIAASLARKEPA